MKRNKGIPRPYSKRYFLYAAAGLVLLALMLLSSGCTTAPESQAKSECQPKPEWIRSPERDGYYVGVGSADSGNRAEDRPTAEARARADLASRISARIKSELEVATTESTAEGASQRVSEKVTQSVEANLQDIETVDVYHCPGEGTWVYVRLSRERWSEIQEQRRRELNTRLRELIEPVVLEGKENFLLTMETLLQGRRLIYESSLGTSVQGTLAGEKGALSDIIGSHINKALSSLSLTLEKEKIDVSAGEETGFSGAVESSIYDRIGNIPIMVSTKGGTGLGSTQTDEAGNFTFRIPEGFEAPGEQHVVVRPSVQDIAGEGLLSRDALPSREIIFSVGRVQVGLAVETSTAVSGVDFSGQITSLLNRRNLPLELVSAEAGGEELPMVLRFLVRIEDFPKVMENAPDMAQARAVVSFEREGKTIFSYESEPVKDGGLNPDQAHQRVSDKLFSSLNEDDELFTKLDEAIITR